MADHTITIPEQHEPLAKEAAQDYLRSFGKPSQGTTPIEDALRHFLGQRIYAQLMRRAESAARGRALVVRSSLEAALRVEEDAARAAKDDARQSFLAAFGDVL